MNTLTLTMAFIMGFTGSLHCAGMCGPIMFVLPFQVFPGLKKALAIGLYHLGRISVYAWLAIFLHSFRSLFDPKLQQYISIILGGSLLVLGIFSFIPSSKLKFNLPWSAQVKKQLAKVIGQPSLGAIAITGVLNGFLPCGLVYMALSASLAATTAWQTTAIMYSFGLGTMPMLLGLTLLKSKLSFIRVGHIRRTAPVIVFLFGCLFVLRGMNLGIPYLSPKVEITQHGIRSCCHKK